jgi:hypothetical protein
MQERSEELTPADHRIAAVTSMWRAHSAFVQLQMFASSAAGPGYSAFTASSR